MITKQIVSNSVEETLTLANKIGARLKGGEVIELVGDLGSGKTTFVSGLVFGAKSKDIVSSPTFVISKRYKTPTLDIHHFDFYRLDRSDKIVHELSDALGQNDAVVLIEWPGIVDTFFKNPKMVIEFSYLHDANKRHIEMKYNKKLEYLIN
jgi:tRNA threonylcarbamoyladenosine biosynthesis protein TsaE